MNLSLSPRQFSQSPPGRPWLCPLTGSKGQCIWSSCHWSSACRSSSARTGYPVTHSTGLISTSDKQTAEFGLSPAFCSKFSLSDRAMTVPAFSQSLVRLPGSPLDALNLFLSRYMLPFCESSFLPLRDRTRRWNFLVAQSRLNFSGYGDFLMEMFPVLWQVLPC